MFILRNRKNYKDFDAHTILSVLLMQRNILKIKKNIDEIDLTYLIAVA